MFGRQWSNLTDDDTLSTVFAVLTWECMSPLESTLIAEDVARLAGGGRFGASCQTSGDVIITTGVVGDTKIMLYHEASSIN